MERGGGSGTLGEEKSGEIGELRKGEDGKTVAQHQQEFTGGRVPFEKCTKEERGVERREKGRGGVWSRKGRNTRLRTNNATGRKGRGRQRGSRRKKK